MTNSLMIDIAGLSRIDKKQKRMVREHWLGLNEYIAAERAGKYVAAKLKAQYTDLVCTVAQLVAATHGWQTPEGKVNIHFIWREKNTRRDFDNIRFGAKFVLDGLVKAGVIVDDSQKYIESLSDSYIVDAANPGVTVIITLSEIGGAEHESN